MIFIAPVVFVLAAGLLWWLDETLDARTWEDARRHGWTL